MARCSQIICVALLVFVSLQIGESLKCYDCAGLKGEDCDNPNQFPTFIKTCSNDTNAVCYKKNTTLTGGTQHVVRNCGYRSDCPESRASDVNTTCTVCTEDLCNSSSYAMPSMLVVSIVAAILAKFYL